jgi:acyl-CoA-binding protein
MSKKDIDILFEEAVTIAYKIAQESLPQDVQLRLYSFYKHATSDNVNYAIQPENLDLRNAFKTNAWMQISHLSKDEAKKMYIETINSIVKK